jgi:RNA polymerase sigma-B factor
VFKNIGKRGYLNTSSSATDICERPLRLSIPLPTPKTGDAFSSTANTYCGATKRTCRYTYYVRQSRMGETVNMTTLEHTQNIPAIRPPRAESLGAAGTRTGVVSDRLMPERARTAALSHSRAESTPSPSPSVKRMEFIDLRAVTPTPHPEAQASAAELSTARRNSETRTFARYAQTRDPDLRDKLVHEHERLARYLATKFGGRGEPLEDLVQVACMGLIKAIDRFDVSRDIKFTTYATATIVGEIQRYFRDTAWRVKVPRAMQELNGRASRAKDALAGSLGRQPTVSEVARAIGATEEATLEAIEVSSAYAPASLDSASAEDGGRGLVEMVGEEDPRIESIVNNGDLSAGLSTLNTREQSVLTDYFFNEMSESQIAKKLCISQMHVSRLKARALSNLKVYMSSATK